MLPRPAVVRWPYDYRTSRSNGCDIRSQGFTLIELLVCIVVVAVLMAVLYPVIASATRSAHRAVCVSNLRQAGTALSLYESDWGILPVGESAYAVLAQAPTCDKEDSWRTSCSAPVTLPRAGSYGYVRLCPDFADDAEWNSDVASDTPPSVLVSIFYGNRQVKPFIGMEVPVNQCLKDHMVGCAMPDRLITLDLDGSAHHRHVGATTIVSGVPYQLFSWPSAFTTNQHGHS